MTETSSCVYTVGCGEYFFDSQSTWKNLFEFVRFQTGNVETDQPFPNNEDSQVVKMQTESVLRSYFAGIDIRGFPDF